MTRRWIFESLHNARDLGGYPTLSGGSTRWGVFLRSDEPRSLTQAEADRLRENNITTVVDLRSAEEAARTPCFLARAAGFAYHHCPLNFVGKLPEKAEDMADFYMEMLGDTAMVCRVMTILARAEGGALFHCAAGKDRTGIMAALLLSLAGVRQEDIVADYQVTYTYIQEMVRRFQKAGSLFPAWLGESRPEYMEGFLARLFRAHTSVEHYLCGIGMAQQDMDTLKAKLVCAD